MVCPPRLVFLALPGPQGPCEVVECLALLPTIPPPNPRFILASRLLTFSSPLLNLSL